MPLTERQIAAGRYLNIPEFEVTDSHRKLTANISMNVLAKKKGGNETPTMHKAVSSVSSHLA